MTITDYQALKKWFFNNSRGEKPAPYWTLYSLNVGDKKTMLTRNDRLSNMAESWAFLEESLQNMSRKGGQFEVMQTDVARGNNPVGTIWFEPDRSQSALPAIAGAPGTVGSGAPAGFISEEEFEKRLREALEKRDLEDRIAGLEAQLANPPKQGLEALWEKLEGFLQTPVGMAIAAKMAGVSPGALAGMVHGTPDPDGEPNTDDELEQMDGKLAEMAAKLGLTETELVNKLHGFVQRDPQTAQTVIAQL